MRHEISGRFKRCKSVISSLICFALVCTLIVSCKSVPNLKPMEVRSSSSEPPVLTLRPGDEIDVKFLYWPELDELQAVRPDGKISLQLVDDVHVAGLTTEQLDKHLTELYEGKIKEPVITVIVRSLANQHVYVGGAIGKPGYVPIQGSLTALDAVLAAGGFDYVIADRSQVVVLQNEGDKRYASLVDLKSALENPESNKYYLGPNDVVWVPHTKIADMNIWLVQHITNMIPDTNLQLTRSKVSGTGTVRTIGLRPNTGGGIR